MKTLTIRSLIILGIILMFTGAYFYFFAMSGCPAYPGVLEECIRKKRFVAILIFAFGLIGTFVSMLELKKALAETKPKSSPKK
jgi:hypothetical protein